VLGGKYGEQQVAAIGKDDGCSESNAYFFWDTTAVREMKSTCISIQAFIYLVIFLHCHLHVLYMTSSAEQGPVSCVSRREQCALAPSERRERREKVNRLILQDRRMSTRQLIATVGIGFNARGTILRRLDCRKLCAGWVPRVLTQDHKEHRLQACTNLLA
jgi:hypothetical protein